MTGHVSLPSVVEITATAGTGDIVLGGNVAGSIRFADRFADGAEVSFSVEDNPRREELRGVFVAPDTLHWLTVTSSTNGGEKIDWPATGRRIVRLGADIGSEIQAWSPELDAISALTVAGFLVRTGDAAYVARSIIGTADRLAVSDGDGVSGDPVLDISADYAGQTSIVTLGTITTGAWEGDLIGLAYGGTGADLSATGGASQVVLQESAGGPLSVRQLSVDDLAEPKTGTGDIVLATDPILAAPTLEAPIIARGTYASRPGSPTIGQLYVVTDSNTIVWGAVVAGGGGSTILAWWNGGDWTVVGK